MFGCVFHTVSIGVNVSTSAQNASTSTGVLMPLYSLDIEKFLGGEYWTNRYVLTAATLAEANGAAAGIYEAERAVHLSLVLFTKYRVSDFNPSTDHYFITQVNANGQGGSANETQVAPLFNVVRVDFTTALGGRPSRKYLRLPIVNGNLIGNRLAPALIAQVTTDYLSGILATPEYVDVDGQSFTQANVYPFVGMRQLRRGSKRKLQPIVT